MIKVKTPTEGYEGFDAWRKKAQDARTEAIEYWKEHGKVPDLRTSVWKELKETLLNKLFCEKCGYCEGRVSAHVTLDVEHYRPKKGVTEGREPIDHDGYFWLAYEWHNLILACRNCNSGHSSYQNGIRSRHPGKANEFRVNGTRVAVPANDPSSWEEELVNEEPLLLHPYFDSPEEHLEFDTLGIPFAKSAKGRETIDVCHLDRIELVDARIDAQSKYRERMYQMISSPDDGPGLFGPETPYSAWLNSCLQRHFAAIASRLGLTVMRT